MSGNSHEIIESIVNVGNSNSKTLFPSFLLIFEIFNYNVHDCSVDFSEFVNIMPLFFANKINVKCDKIGARRI